MAPKKNNSGFKILPEQENELITHILVQLAEKAEYVLYHEQQKVLANEEYLRKWRRV